MSVFVIDQDRKVELPDPERKGMTLQAFRAQRCNHKRARGDCCHDRRAHSEHGKRLTILDRVVCKEAFAHPDEPDEGSVGLFEDDGESIETLEAYVVQRTQEDIEAYLAERAEQDARDVSKKKVRRRLAVIIAGMDQERWARRVRKHPELIVAEILMLAKDPDVGDLRLATELGLNDLMLAFQITAA